MLALTAGRGDRGQGSVEYVGGALLAAAVVVTLFVSGGYRLLPDHLLRAVGTGRAAIGDGTLILTATPPVEWLYLVAGGTVGAAIGVAGNLRRRSFASTR